MARATQREYTTRLCETVRSYTTSLGLYEVTILDLLYYDTHNGTIPNRYLEAYSNMQSQQNLRYKI